jgi:Na+-translocating ferredoxin:NAD+ oxidoreductase subunit B
MAMDIYRKLAEHLDNLPGGFPPTESGVELRILRRLFTPEEAELALHLTLIPEEARVIARRAKIPIADAAGRLDRMARKGLLLDVRPKDAQPLYLAAQYIIGIWEHQLNNLDTEFIRDMDEYFPTLSKESWKLPQLRTIPVDRSITPQMEILPYEKAEELVRGQKKFGVAPCICRREQKMVGKGCGKTEEACLLFGFAVDYYVRNGIGRVIDLQECLSILKTADEQGLVLQPGNTQKIMNICCCCGDCCGVLRILKKYPKPSSQVFSPFVAFTNPDACEGCGLCVDRCQMEALSIIDEKAVLSVDRCIGCGLCVSTCPTQSLTLVRKPESEQPIIPKDVVKAAIRRGQERGKLSTVKLVQMQLKSKLDRLLAAAQTRPLQ